MTNTTNAQSPVPSSLTGPVCSRCSHWTNGSRVQVRHASVAAVRECCTAPIQLTIEVPATPVSAPKHTSPAPVVKSFNRWSAKCPRPGCKTHAVKDAYFILKCSNHGKPVRVKAKQLQGTLSTSAKHKCNSSCLAAVGATCTCQCGGANHGVGLMVTLNG